MENEWQGPYSVLEKCNVTTYKLNMPDHPRRRVKIHINLLREFVSLIAKRMMVSTEPDLEFAPRKEGRPARDQWQACGTRKKRVKGSVG